jgi:hypothetical protein
MGIKEVEVGTTLTYKRITEAPLKKVKGPLSHLLLVMTKIGIKADEVALLTVSEISDKIVELNNENKIHPLDLKELVTSPLCMYFGLWCRLNEVWSVKKVENEELEDYKYWLPYWSISNVRNFKFFFTLAFQSLVNMMAIFVGLMGGDVRTNDQVNAMLNEPLYTNQVLNWTKEDRDLFFNDDEEVHFKILMVSSNVHKKILTRY